MSRLAVQWFGGLFEEVKGEGERKSIGMARKQWKWKWKRACGGLIKNGYGEAKNRPKSFYLYKSSNTAQLYIVFLTLFALL
ncbi:hypothetical protein BDV12DRAFT_123790 [Aspergillus spectabilis]